MDVLLDHWDSIELFCRVVARIKKMPLKEFQNNTTLLNMMGVYAHKQPCAEVSTMVYRETSEKLDFSKAKWENKKLNESEIERSFNQSFYNLVKCIRYSRPFYTKDFILDGYSQFIRKKDFAADTKKYLDKFSPSKKQRLLEGTKWWLYFHDEWNALDGSVYLGVSRALLELKPFGKAVLKRKKHGVDETRLYSGIFRLYKDDHFLALKMKVKESDGRDLRMLLYIGSDNNVELAIGLSANIHESFYARTVMIEPLKKADKAAAPGFYCKELDTTNYSDIPDYAWSYLEDKSKNMIRAPKNITTKEQFYRWKKRSR